MEFIVTHPKDPTAFKHMMIKFQFIADDYTLSFVIEGYVQPDKLKESLSHLVPEQDLEIIIDSVCNYYEDAQIGKEEFFEITSVATIKRILPIEAQTK